ncbi:MAG: GNAT family N-acetyltransferase, partial [Actinomycetota bacterium]
MRISLRPLAAADVDAMLAWRYDPPYDMYDHDADPSDVELMRAAVVSGEGWYAADDIETGELVGFFEFVGAADEIDVGLGLRPDLTGRGLGAGFLRQGLSFARDRWSPVSFALDVF